MTEDNKCNPEETTGLMVNARTCNQRNPCCLHDLSPNEAWEECCGYCMKRSEIDA